MKPGDEWTTYEMADGSVIGGDFGWVVDIDHFDCEDEPVDLIKKVWVLQSVEDYQYVPPGWTPPEEEDA